MEQLKEGGRMVIPVGTQSQDFIQVDKSLDGRVSQKTLFGVRGAGLAGVSTLVCNYCASKLSPDRTRSQIRQPLHLILNLTISNR